MVGFMNSGLPGPFGHLAEAFRKGLAEQGFEDGRNIAIEYRWAEGRYDRLPDLAQELVRRGATAIAATGGGMSTRAAIAATNTLPIVFAIGEDPVKFGFVASLNRPGGNVTGVTQLTADLGTKRLSLLRELLPEMRRLALLLNPDFPDSARQHSELEEASRSARLELVVQNARTEADFEPAIKALRGARPDALLVGADPYFNSRRARLVSLVEQARLPAIWEFREFAQAGGLISYGTDLADAYRHVGIYVGRVLKGERPADLPVLQAAKFEMVINLRTAKVLGLNVPATLLARADEVLE